MLRILLTGGGTGGHVNPAIAIADTVKMNQPDAQIAFVGTRTGKENDLVHRAGYPLYYVESMGIRRSLSLSNLKAIYLAVTSPYSKKTTAILRDFDPDVVIGTGGYVCWPILKAASRFGIPTVVHESNCLPGLAVRRLQGCVDSILLNYPESKDLLKVPEKCAVVGNPLVGGFGNVDRSAARRSLGLGEGNRLVLCYAGSIGSSTVNMAVLQMLSSLAGRYPETRFLLSTGARNYEEAEEMCRQLHLLETSNVKIQPYIYDMPIQMAAADIVISRAGAMSLSELARMGKAAVIVPSPYVADNHQYRNAKALADKEAALLVQEKDFSAGALTEAVEDLLKNQSHREALSRNIRAFAVDDANRRIYEKIVTMAAEYRSH